MDTRKIGSIAARWAAAVLLVFALGYIVNASSCNNGDSELRQFGESMGREAATGSAPSNHKYVGNVHKQLYWPNKKKYVDKIPKGSRVYIYDDKMLKEFKGYKPGPL